LVVACVSGWRIYGPFKSAIGKEGVHDWVCLQTEEGAGKQAQGVSFMAGTVADVVGDEN
jgi:hypothetical protein